MPSQWHRDGVRHQYLHRLASENSKTPKSPPTLTLLLCVLTIVQTTAALSFDNPNIPAQLFCSTVLLSWSGGVGPYDLQIWDVNLGVQLEDFPRLAGTSMEWVTGGKVEQRNVFAEIIDSTGASARTGQIPVGPGSPNDCTQQQDVSPTSTSLTPTPTTTNIVPPMEPSTTLPHTTVTTTTSTSQTTTKGSSSTIASATPTSSTSPSPSPSSSALGSTSISSASSTSASATNSQSEQPSPPTSTPTVTQSPPTAPSSSKASTPLSSSSSSIPSSPPPIGTSKPRSHSLSPGVKVAIAIAVIIFVAGLGTFVFWLRRRALHRRKIVRSSGERADLNQESRPLLAELESPGRALVAQRAWAGSSPPWASGQGGDTFNPNDDGEDYVLVIEHPPPRSTDAQASGWQSDFNPATAMTMTTRTSAGRPSLISTTTRVPVHDDRYTDSPIDPLLPRRGSTRPSSHVLPSAGANTTSDLEAFYALMDAEAASHTREGRLTGTEIDSAVDTASEREEWDALSASDTRSVRTLPPPYHHHSV